MTIKSSIKSVTLHISGKSYSSDSMIIISVSCEGSAQFIDNGPAQTIVPIVTDGSSIKTARADDLDGLALIAVSIANAKIYGSAFDDSIYLYGGGST